MAKDQRIPNPNFLAGQIHALVTFSQALATTHHNPKQLLLDFEDAEQVGLAKIESTLVSDSVVRGYQQVMDHLRAAIGHPKEKN
jgi:hypothetical protein